MLLTSPRMMRPDGSSRAERLLSHMQRLHNHDLPNEMVALQSLLQLLSFDESKNLSEDGREYVRRLQNAAKRASDIVRILKELGRLNAHECAAEKVELDRLARELQGELQRGFPELQFQFKWQWRTPAVFGDSRVYLHAVVELCKVLVPASTKALLVQAGSRRRGDFDTLEFSFRDTALTQFPQGNHPIAAAPAEPLEVVLAREWLALCGADLQFDKCDSSGAAFLINVPSRVNA